MLLANGRRFEELRLADPAEMDPAEKVRATAATALGVLVPAEIIAAATALSGLLSEKSTTGDGAASWLHLDLARLLIAVLGVFAIPLLLTGGDTKWWKKNGARGVLLVLLTIVSFAVWLALQPLSVYQDALNADSASLAAIGSVAAVVIGGLAGLLGASQASVKTQ